MTRAQGRLFLAGCAFAAYAATASCTLTGPLDGYAEGPADAAPDVTDVEADVAEPDADTCPVGFADCDGLSSNGCETNLLTNKDRCGSCTTKCSVANGSPECIDGSCAIAACNEGFGDCDDQVSSGCETDVFSSLQHCGDCGTPCDISNGSASCNVGVCEILSCFAPYDSCDDLIETGCEVNTDEDAEHCGSCEISCPAVDQATAVCAAGACSYQCAAGFGDCDQTATNGCETNTSSSVTHCGGCDKACSTVNAQASCQLGACNLSCAANFDDCNNDVDDGCETSLLTDIENCNGCGTVCPAPPPSSQKTCSAGVCGFRCIQGQGDCNSDAVDGCETGLTTSPQNCGMCGHSCLGAGCSAGLCNPMPLVVQGQKLPWGIRADASSVFWSDPEEGGIYKVAKAGGARVTIADFGADGPIALGASEVFWDAGLRLDKAPKTGGSVTTLANEQNIEAIQVFGSSVYYLTGGTWTAGIYNNDGKVRRIPAGGGLPEDLAAGEILPSDLAVDEYAVYWASEGTFSAGSFHGFIKRARHSDGDVAELASDQPRPCAVAAVAPYLYWSNCQDGSIWRVLRTGGTPFMLTTDQKVGRQSLEVDSEYVFWSYPGDTALTATGFIKKVPTAGGDTLNVALAQNHPRDLAIDSTFLYWTNSGTDTTPPPGDGAVQRVAK